MLPEMELRTSSGSSSIVTCCPFHKRDSSALAFSPAPEAARDIEVELAAMSSE
jgi:hypothetical protein